MYIHTYIAENDRTTGHTNKEVTRATATKAATTTRTVNCMAQCCQCSLFKTTSDKMKRSNIP